MLSSRVINFALITGFLFSASFLLNMNIQQEEIIIPKDIENIDVYDPNFNKIAEFIQKNYYSSKNEESKQTKHGTLARSGHGFMHVARVCFLVDYLFDFYLKHGYDKIDPEAGKFLKSKEFRRLLKLAALLHDAGRKSGEKDIYEEISAKICELFFTHSKSKVPQEIAQGIASTIIKEKNFDLRSFAQHILITADSIDILRTRGFTPFECKWRSRYFDYLRLAPFKLHFKDNQKAKKELLTFILAYRKMLEKQYELYNVSPITKNEIEFLNQVMKIYKIKKMPSKEAFLEKECFFRHVLKGRNDITEEEKEKLYKIDANFSYEKKAKCELSDKCYKHLKRDFEETLSSAKRAKLMI